MDVQTLGAALSIMKKSSMDPEQIETAVDSWLDENITNPSNPPLDRSLTQDSAAAPADMVGDLNQALNVETELVDGVVNSVTEDGILNYGKGLLTVKGQISDTTGAFAIGSSVNIGAVKGFLPLIIGRDITFDPNGVSCNVYFYDSSFAFIESKYTNANFSSSVFTISNNQYAYCRVALYKTNIATTDYDGFKIYSKILNNSQNTIAKAESRLDQFGLENEYVPVLALLERGSYNSSGVKQNDLIKTQCRTIEKIKTADVDFILLDRSVKDIVVYVNYWNESDVHQTRATYTGDVAINKGYASFAVSIIDYTGSSYSNPISMEEAYKYVTLCRVNGEKIKVNGEADSIPAYTEMLSKYGMECFPVEFENGRINSSTGADYPINDTSRPYRIRSVGYLPTSIDYVIDLRKKEYYVYIFYYNSSKVFQTSTSGQTGNKIAINKDYAYFRLQIFNYDSSSYSNPISPAECYQNIFVGNETAFSYLVGNETALSYLTKYNIPDYFDSQLAAVKTSIMNHNGMIGKNGASFVFLTDLHWANNQKHSPALVKYVVDNDMINRIVLGGDYLTDHATKANAMTAMDLCMKDFFNLSDNVFPIFGNHDRNSNSAGIDPDKNLTDAESYSLMNQWMNNEVVYGTNFFDFYWDDNKSNTRYVMIDTGAQTYDPSGRISEDTFTWLETVLNTDKNIIVFAHWLFSATTWNHPLVDHVLTGSYTESAQRLFTMLDNVNSGGGKVQAIITGHVHCDYNAETTGGIPIIWTDTDGMQALGDYTATAGTVSEQCIDVITIDYNPENRKIYCDRIGRGVSREISY